MGILDKARTLESRIARALSRAAEDAVGSDAREPLEIAHAIVDVIDREVQSGSRGTRLFPFNRVAVSVLAASRESRARLEALFAAPPSLRDRVLDRRRSAGGDGSGLQIDVAYGGRAGRTIRVPAGSRGVGLRSGDEIALGEARVRIRIEEGVRATS